MSIQATAEQIASLVESHFKTQSKIGKNWSRYDICEETRARIEH